MPLRMSFDPQKAALKERGRDAIEPHEAFPMIETSMLTRRELIKSLSAAGLVTANLGGAARFAHAAEASGADHEDLLQWVDVRLGTGGHGHTYPGATMPFGMVQLSPDTTRTPDEWDWCSGYHTSQNVILGFSHTHLSGTGCGDLLDFLVMPGVGEPVLNARDLKNPEGFGSTYSHDNEKAHPGYYSVLLDRAGIVAELTATERAGLHRYTFPASKSSYVVLDLAHCYGHLPTTINWCSVSQPDDRTLLAGHSTSAWGADRQMYAAFRFRRAFERVEYYLDGVLVMKPEQELRGRNLKVVVYFSTSEKEAVLVKAGLSAVSAEGALKNLDREIPAWDFEGVCRAAEQSWRDQLAKIHIETADRDQKTIFYTALYHTMLAPTLFDDVDGQYRGMDGKAHQLPSGQHNYTTFSLWDTYRAEHPLFTLIHPERVPDMVNSLIRMAVESPAGMPVWPLGGTETGCMTGYHSATVIAEACAKGFTGIDYKAAYEAMKKRALTDNYRGLQWYRELGFIPADREEESVSKTLEYDYNDWAISCVAEHLGDHETARKLKSRSTNYRNYWDAKSGFLRARLENKEFAEPFNPIEMGHSKRWRDYTESNAWQTTFGVQHDVTRYIDLMGGDEAFLRRLDMLFDQPSTLPANAPPDISGMIGQYAHGNEPSHHIAYLYTYAGQPEKTQYRVHQVNSTLYKKSVDEAIAGNEDCGQMSAWFVLSAIGFYSVDPVSAQYIFGTPLFDRAVIRLAGGRELVFESNRKTSDSIYIQSVSFNGKAHAASWFSHAQVQHGGHFVFNLEDKPGKQFGKSVADRPHSAVQRESA